MPIDLEALSKDPAFQAKSPAEQQALMGRAHERNTLESQSGTPTPAVQEPQPWWERATEWLQAGEEGRLPLAPTTSQWVRMTPAQQEQRLQQARDMGKSVLAGGIQTGLTMGAAAAGAATGPFAPVAIPVLEAGATYASNKINQALGLQEPNPIMDIASVALPPVVRGVTAAIPAAARLSRAGRAVTQAAEDTTAATTATTARNTRAQQLYEARVGQAEQAAAAKTTAQEAKYQRGVQEARTRAEEQTIAEQQAYQAQVQGYETAVGQHRTAKAELQAMPGQFGPETPSKTLYAAAAKANPQVELRQTAAMAEELMGTPEGLQTIQRGGVQSLAEELHELAGQSLSRDGLSYARLQKIREDLGSEVGRLRRQGGTEYRDVARLYGALERDLGGSEASVLQAASKARRQEYAVEELNAMVQTGAPGIKRLSSGAYQVDPGQLMTRAEKALNDTEKMFGGSFTPDERGRILQQFERHQGLTPIPRRPGEPPVPVTPRDVPVPEPVTPRSILKPVPLEAPPPVDPRTRVQPPSGTRIMGELMAGGATAMYGGNITAGVLIGGADIGEYVISKALLSPQLRPLLDRMMGASGTISPENMQVLMNAVRAMGSMGGESRTRR